MDELAAKSEVPQTREPWPEKARICVTMIGGKQYISIDHIGMDSKELYNGTRTFYPITDRERYLSLDEIIALFKSEQNKQSTPEQPTLDREALIRQQMIERLRRIIVESDSKNEQDKARKMYFVLTGEDFKV